MAIWAQATASHSALWWWVRGMARAWAQAGQVLPAGDQVPGHGDAVDVLKIGVLPDVGVAVGCQRGLDDGHIKPGIVRDEGFAGQEGMQLLPDGEKIRGVFRVLRVNSVDMNVALVISVAWRLDQVVGGGDHPQPHHKGQAHRAGTVGVAGGCLKINGDKVHMLVGGKGERLFVANHPWGITPFVFCAGFAGGTGRNTSPSADPFLL